MADAVIAEWIAVDWGTSRLRAWAMDGDQVLAEASSDDGMGRLTQDRFEPALISLVSEWLGDGMTTVLACGMVGARQGWQEAPYRAVPCAPVAAGDTVKVETQDPRLDVRIIAGLSQAAPADVMRGEEVQIAGFLSQLPDFEGVLLLPGTHSKHVDLVDGQVQRFATHMTGEHFNLICAHSILKHSVAEGDHDPVAFADGVQIGCAGNALKRLFSIRAEGLVGQSDPVAARSKLSGMLIGAELADLDTKRPTMVIGSGALCDLYLAALVQIGVDAAARDGGDLVRAGLTKLYLTEQA